MRSGVETTRSTAGPARMKLPFTRTLWPRYIRILAEPHANLHVVAGGTESFGDTTVFGTNPGSLDHVPEQELTAYVATSPEWAGALPRISRQSRGAVRLARDAINATIEAGKVPFRFDDLYEAVSSQAAGPPRNLTRGYEGVVHQSDDENPIFVRTSSDKDRYEYKIDQLEERVSMLHRAIDGLRRRDSTKTKLRSLIECLARRVRDGESTRNVDVGRELKIAPQTISDYLKTIRELESKIG